MNTENRCLFLATPGGKSELIARAVIAERIAAQQARIDYIKTKEKDGIVNLWAGDSDVSALIVKAGAPIPAGWRRSSKLHRKHFCPQDGTFIVPDGKKKDTYAALVAEVRALPKLPDAWAFTGRLGSDVIVRGMALQLCVWEVIGDAVVISVPMALSASEAESECEKAKEQFVPADSVPLKWSEYFAMKEKVEEKKK